MDRKKYSDGFKKEVAEAASKPGVTLKSVGEHFGVSPTLVRNWKIQFSSSSDSRVNLSSLEENENKSVSVCLSFGSIKASYIETREGDWIDEEDALSDYRFEGTTELDPSSLGNWCNTNINLEFDGDLDDPDVFIAIKAVKVCGPTLAEYSPEGLILESVAFYLEVTAIEDIDDSNLDDLFHTCVPILSVNGSKMAFTEFEGYEAYFEEVPDEGKDILALWPNE